VPTSNFDSIGWALLTIFQLHTTENWNSVMYDGVRTTGPHAAIFFVTVLVVGHYVLLNLFVAILLDNFGNDNEEQSGGGQQEGQLAVEASAGSQQGSAVVEGGLALGPPGRPFNNQVCTWLPSWLPGRRSARPLGCWAAGPLGCRVGTHCSVRQHVPDSRRRSGSLLSAQVAPLPAPGARLLPVGATTSSHGSSLLSSPFAAASRFSATVQPLPPSPQHQHQDQHQDQHCMTASLAGEAITLLRHPVAALNAGQQSLYAQLPAGQGASSGSPGSSFTAAGAAGAGGPRQAASLMVSCRVSP
jgi:hypothetical protein